jgi:hypothetical protein
MSNETNSIRGEFTEARVEGTRSRDGISSGRGIRGSAAVAQIAKTIGVGMEEDALDLAVGRGHQHGREGAAVPPKDHRRLPVELSLLGVERGNTRRRRRESGDIPRALERPPKVPEAADSAAL